MVKDYIFKDFIRRHWMKYIFGIMALVSSCLLQLAIPKLLGQIIDVLKTRVTGQNQIFGMTLEMMGIAIIVFGLKYAWRYLLAGKARDLECFLREKLFAHLQTLPVKFYHEKKTGDLMAYAINDLNAVRRLFAFGLIFLIDGIIINMASLLVMAKTINLYLTLIALGPLCVAVLLILKAGKPLRRNFTKVQAAFAKISEKIQENISGIRVVKAYVQEEDEIHKVGQASLNRMKVQLNYIKLSALLGPATQICFGLSFTLVLIIGSRLVTQRIISLGDFIAFNTYLTMLLRPISNVGKLVEAWQMARASIQRLDEIFTIRTDIVDDDSITAKPELQGNIVIRDLNFTYPGSNRRALKNINLEVEAGKTLAILGKTGSGKTTLLNLLLHLYPVQPEHLFFDGIDINEIPLATLRENIGCVPQDNFLFSATIRENIEFFKNDAYSEDEVEEAARMSSVYENIMDFPEGFETVVGERGITLSGGQKQRVSIARALIKDPKILILDDSLSAVDTKTEEEILSNIKAILNGRTGIIVAHRVSTIKHADEIIVLDKGKIIERGTHQKLMNEKGYYYQLYQAQLAEHSLQEVEEAARCSTTVSDVF